MSDETLLTVRGLEACRDFFTQEFARIIFVDDIHNYSTKIENHEPFHQRPDYATLNIPKIVSILKALNKRLNIRIKWFQFISDIELSTH